MSESFIWTKLLQETGVHDNLNEDAYVNDNIIDYTFLTCDITWSQTIPVEDWELEKYFISAEEEPEFIL